MNSYLNILLALLLLAGCNQTQTPQKYSIETLMSNNRSSGGYFSKDGRKLLYSSDKSGIFNLYEIELNTYTENQLTTSALFALSVKSNSERNRKENPKILRYIREQADLNFTIFHQIIFNIKAFFPLKIFRISFQ